MSTPEFASAPFTAGQLNALVKIIGPGNVPGLLDGTLKSTVKQSDLLKWVATVTVPAVQRFVVKDCLKAANIGWTGDNFNRLLKGKVEKDVPKANLVIHRLERASLDVPILAELGDKAEVKLSYLIDLLKKQKDGKDGVLLTNGYANISYVCDTKGNLWAVNTRWDPEYCFWSIEVDISIKRPVRWFCGFHVLSRVF